VTPPKPSQINLLDNSVPSIQVGVNEEFNAIKSIPERFATPVSTAGAVIFEALICDYVEDVDHPEPFPTII
jgi:hypothetical protein